MPPIGTTIIPKHPNILVDAESLEFKAAAVINKNKKVTNTETTK